MTQPGARRRPGRWPAAPRRPLLVVDRAGRCGVAVVLALGDGGLPPARRPLDPQNPDPDGAQAVARVLADEGVEVTIVRTADALHDADVGPGTTVLVTSHRQAGAEHDRRLAGDDRRRRRSCSWSRPARPRGARRRGRAGAASSDDPRPADCVETDLDDLLSARGAHDRRPTTRRRRLLPGDGRRAAGAAGDGVVLLGAGDVAHQRPGPARPTTRRSPCGCSASTTGWSGTSPTSTTGRRRRASASASLLPDWLRPGAVAGVAVA